MRFIIDGTEYRTDDLGELTHRDMLAMVKQAGMGVQTWAKAVDQFTRLALAPNGEGVVVLSEAEAKAAPERIDGELIFDSPRHLQAFLITVWLARRLGGNPSLTFEESIAVKHKSVTFVFDADDEPEDVTPDPPNPSASAPVADSAPVPSMTP